MNNIEYETYLYSIKYKCVTVVYRKCYMRESSHKLYDSSLYSFY